MGKRQRSNTHAPKITGFHARRSEKALPCIWSQQFAPDPCGPLRSDGIFVSHFKIRLWESGYQERAVNQTCDPSTTGPPPEADLLRGCAARYAYVATAPACRVSISRGGRGRAASGARGNKRGPLVVGRWSVSIIISLQRTHGYRICIIYQLATFRIPEV